MKEKKNKYHNECAKLQKVNQRLQNEKTAVEERQEELV